MAEKTTAVQRAPSTGSLRVVEPRILLERMTQMHEEIARRAFELFERDGALGHDWENWFNAEEQFVHPVHVSISESGAALRVQAEVPGFEARDIEIALEPMRLTISGRKEARQNHQEKGRVIYQEICSSELLRIIDLPAEVAPERARAALKNGVLDLELPKAGKLSRKRAETSAA